MAVEKQPEQHTLHAVSRGTAKQPNVRAFLLRAVDNYGPHRRQTEAAETYSCHVHWRERNGSILQGARHWLLGHPCLRLAVRAGPPGKAFYIASVLTRSLVPYKSIGFTDATVNSPVELVVVYCSAPSKRVVCQHLCVRESHFMNTPSKIVVSLQHVQLPSVACVHNYYKGSQAYTDVQTFAGVVCLHKILGAMPVDLSQLEMHA